MTFRLTQSPILETAPLPDIVQQNTGAFVSFKGIVRNINNGKKVKTIEYEAFKKMVLLEAEKINLKISKKYDIQGISTIHRIGLLKVGEIAILVRVVAMHRKAAFHACEALMDLYKHTLPIWKKETYEDGESEWVFCNHH